MQVFDNAQAAVWWRRLCGGSLLEKRKWGTPVFFSSARLNVAHIMGLTYYGSMNVTLSLDDDLVKEVRKIAVERDTTLTGLVRSYLQELALEHAKSGRKRREIEALREGFEKYQFNIGKRTWKREDLHERC